MAHRDDDYQDLRKFDVEDIFESDDDDFELENPSSDDYGYASPEDIEKYSYVEETMNEKPEDDEEIEENTAENLKFDFKDEIEEDDYKEETEPEVLKKQPVMILEETGEEIPILSEKEQEEIESKKEEPPFNPDGTINENADPMLIIDDPDDKETAETEKEQVIKPNCEKFNNYLDKNLDESKTYDTCKNEEDKMTINEIVDHFRETVKYYYKRYTENDLVNYINDFINEDENRNLFKDMYVMNYCKYSIAIDFKNEVAKQSLWVITAGNFADEIEASKRNGDIETSVETTELQFDQNKIIEDKNVASTRAYQKAQEAKYAQYKLDRTIFNISEVDDENTSIFDDKRTIHRDFYESEFYQIHKEVMTSDRFADMNNITSTVTIDEATSFIPIIDYSTGIRVICIDTNDTDQYHLNPLIISKKVRFAYNVNPRDIKVRILYLDDVIHRPIAVTYALKKLIAFNRINPRYKIRLAHNYVIAYTTEARWIEMFEKGDIDTRSPENSTYYTSKPSNMCIGIVVLDKKSDKDKRSIRRNQISRDIGRYESVSTDDYNIQFVISGRVTRNDLRLRNPSIPREERYVEYTITQYNECNPVIITDGFQTLVACIIKEHKANYDPGTPYSISFEYDRDSLVSPSVIALLDTRNGLEPAYGQRTNGVDIDSMFTLPPSRLKMGGVQEFEYGRLDKRYFTPAAIQRKYDRSLWNSYDLTTRDGRIQFIRSRGFEEFFHNKPLLFDVMPYALNMLETGEVFRDIIKVSPTMLADKNSQDTEAILFKQAELNYKKSLGDTPYGKFKMFMVEALDTIIDMMANKNNAN